MLHFWNAYQNAKHRKRQEYAQFEIIVFQQTTVWDTSVRYKNADKEYEGSYEGSFLKTDTKN
jgi:hypothetical protein